MILFRFFRSAALLCCAVLSGCIFVPHTVGYSPRTLPPAKVGQPYDVTVTLKNSVYNEKENTRELIQMLAAKGLKFDNGCPDDPRKFCLHQKLRIHGTPVSAGTIHIRYDSHTIRLGGLGAIYNSPGTLNYRADLLIEP